MCKKSFEKLKIHPRWSNISIAMNSNKVDIKELTTYLEEFSMDLGLDELKDATLFNLICKQKYNKAESLKNLLLSYKGTISFDTNIPEENLVILLEQNKIVLNDANFRAAARKPMVIEQFIYQNSIYAEKLNYIGFDRVVWTYLFRSSKLSSAIKSKILNIWRSSYLPTSDQEVVVLSDVLLNWSISETIPSNIIEHCLKNMALTKETKENIIIKCCRNLDKPTLIRFVNYVDPLYGEMISKSKTQIDKTKINLQIMSLLKDKSILNYNYGSKNCNIK